MPEQKPNRKKMNQVSAISVNIGGGARLGEEGTIRLEVADLTGGTTSSPYFLDLQPKFVHRQLRPVVATRTAEHSGPV